MKTSTLLLVSALSLTAPSLLAQTPPGDPRLGPPPGRGPRPHPPLIVALDLNTNGVIDAEELAQASASLSTLDKNKDGQLSADEIQLQRPPRPPRGPGGPPDEGAPGQPGLHQPRFVPPLVAALDTDADGIISAQELAVASIALKKLDHNGDGQLTIEELQPPRPEPPGRPGEDGRRRPRPPQEQ